MFFNEQGIIDIDEMIFQEPSWQNIMADEIVTEEEIGEQTKKVTDMLHEVEHRFSKEDQLFIKKLFAETNVLTAIYRYYELKNIR